MKLSKVFKYKNLMKTFGINDAINSVGKRMFCRSFKDDSIYSYPEQMSYNSQIEENEGCVSEEEEEIQFTVVDYNSKSHSISAMNEDNLFDTIVNNNISINTECGKNRQCGLCHCILSPDIFKHKDFVPAKDSELDVIHILSPLTDYSRFSCQTTITKAFHNKKVYLVNYKSGKI